VSVWWLIGIAIGAFVLVLLALVLGLCRVAGEADEWSERLHRELLR
jgi:hypothetical protein